MADLTQKINRIANNVSDTYSVLSDMGAEMPAEANSDNLADTAASISAVLYGKAQSLSEAQKEQARSNIGAMAASASGGSASITGKTATLGTSWTEQSDGSYAQTVSTPGVTDSNAVIVDCALSGFDIDADVAVLEAWGCVNRAAQAANSLTFYCYGDKPTVAIPLNVVIG